MMMRNLPTSTTTTMMIVLVCVISLGSLLDPTSAQQEESAIKKAEETAARGIFVFPSSDDEYDQVEFIPDVIGEESGPSATIRNPPPRYGRKSPNRQSGRYPYVDTFLQALEPFLNLDVDVSPNSFFAPDYNVHHHHHHNPNEVPFHFQHQQSAGPPLHKPPPQQQHRPPKRVPPQQQHPQKQQSFKFPTEKPQQRPTQPQRPPQRPPHQSSNNNIKHPSVVFNKPPIKLHPGSFDAFRFLVVDLGYLCLGTFYASLLRFHSFSSFLMFSLSFSFFLFLFLREEKLRLQSLLKRGVARLAQNFIWRMRTEADFRSTPS